MRTFKIYTAILLMLLAAWACWINRHEVLVYFPWGGSTHTYAYIAYLAAYALGALTMLVLVGIPYTMKSMQLRKVRKELAKYESKIQTDIPTRFEA